VIADVVFDVPVWRVFAYAIPRGMELHRGQRVSAPLRGRARTGMVVDLRYGDETGLQAIARPVDGVPVLSRAALELGRWVAEESLSSWGSTLLALSPPVARRGAPVIAPPAEISAVAGPPPELWVGALRETHLIEQLRATAGSVLVVAPDRDGAARWADELDADRLDSGVSDSLRRDAWFAAARGRSRIVVGTRSALLVPLPPPATLVLLDEHDPAHKPPGAPRLHSREVLSRRAALEGSRLLMLSATPSVESWWRAQSTQAFRRHERTEGWPEIVTADTRGILRNHPLTLPLTRAIEDATRRGRRAALVVGRRTASLVCGECGSFVRCSECGVPLPFSRGRDTLACRLCARAERLPERCPTCGGRRLSAFGWDAERVEGAVRKRFPKLGVSRADTRAQIAIGPPGILKASGRGALGCVGIVALDSLLGMPDFRGGERGFDLLWAAAEAVRAGGRVVVQTLHPDHYAVQAARTRDFASFYEHEIKLRSELGYPPFRRLAVLSVRSRSEGEAQTLVADCARALDGISGLTVYPAAPRGAAGATPRLRWQFMIKGPAGLPRLLAPTISSLLDARRRAGNVIEIEMDPVS
jgi:primosomal protein N' (replication factor Y)